MQRRHPLCFAHDLPHHTGAALHAANNASFTAPATVSITANAADSDGSITQVQFYGGDLNSNPSATLLTTDTTAPYSFDLINVAAGSYTITAKATDNSTSNNSTISSPIQFTVNTPASTGQVYFIHTDQLNTPRLITNSTNVKVWQWDNNDPFGNNVPNDDPNNSNTRFSFNLRFPGQYADSETGLNYNYFRDYSPQEGRYIQSDPIGLAGGINTYAYVNGNPISKIDPQGLAATGGAIGGQVGGYVGGVVGGAIGGLAGPEGIPAGAAAGRAAGRAAGAAAGSAIQDACSPDKPCPPCKTVSGQTVAVGTFAYRPLDTPSKPEHGIVGPHYNIYKANQIPSPNCNCFWQSIGAVSPSGLPAGAIPIEPFLN